MFIVRHKIIVAAALIAAIVALITVYQLGGSGDAANEIKQTSSPDISDLQNRINSYKQIADVQPADPAILETLGNTYLQIGASEDKAKHDLKFGLGDAGRSYQNAADYYKRYLALVPNDQEVMIYLSIAYSDSEMTDEAVNTLKQAISINPDNQRVRYSLGWVLLKAKRLPEASLYLKQAYDLDPESKVGQQAKQYIDSTDSPDYTNVHQTNDGSS